MARANQIFLGLIYSILVIGLIVAIVLSFHNNKVNVTRLAPNITSVAKPKTSSAKLGSTTPQKPTAANTPTSQSSPTPTQTTLSNTGPGDVVYLFTASTAIFYVLALAYRVKTKLY